MGTFFIIWPGLVSAVQKILISKAFVKDNYQQLLITKAAEGYDASWSKQELGQNVTTQI